jgi:phasin
MSEPRRCFSVSTAAEYLRLAEQCEEAAARTPHQAKELSYRAKIFRQLASRRKPGDTPEANFHKQFEKIGTAASEAADVMTNCCSAAFKGMQDYRRKLIEFSQANAQSHVEFLQKLASVKSPTEWLELSANYTRSQLERMGDQARHLTELTKQVTLATTEPVKTGLAKAYDRAA